MIRVILLWLFLFAIVFLGIGTWRSWTKKASWEIAKYFGQASVAATIVTLLLMLIVFIF